jgi:hypothetical protein
MPGQHNWERNAFEWRTPVLFQGADLEFAVKLRNFQLGILIVSCTRCRPIREDSDLTQRTLRKSAEFAEKRNPGVQAEARAPGEDR